MYRYIERFFFNFWWIILFGILCFMLYEETTRKTKQEFEKFQKQLTELQKQKEEALKIQEDLSLQINSESDPAWIELTLIRELGLVPEGQTKVFFQNNSE